MRGILDGIRIVDWTVFQVGPFAAAMLADVVHVESPEGDLLRGLRSAGLNPMRERRHVNFEEHNRNKRGIAVDLKTEAGREVLYRLVGTADVFMTNLRPKAITKLGMDADTLRRHRADLIYAQATAFGRHGPDRDLPSVDPIGLARSGMMLASGFAGAPPTPISVGTGDRATAFMFAYGILGALLGRERFGIVQDVHNSMLGACLVLHGWTVLALLLMGEEYPRPARPDGERGQGAMVPTFRCADGRWIMISVMTDAHWAQFRDALPNNAELVDPRFRTIAGRIEHQAVLEGVLTALFLTRNAGAWADLFRERAADIYFTQVHTPADLASDSQVKLNDYIVDWDHPAWGVVPWVGFPVDWSETPAQLRSPAPEHGEHTEAILQEIGNSWDAIGRLKDDGVI